MQVQVGTSSDVPYPPVILHVVVIGFHHKRGSQVDFAHPHLPNGALSSPSTDCTDEGSCSHEENLPVEWKSLPSLSLPDGAHNFPSDTVFFHLPSLDSSSSILYCVSCFKQVVASESLKEKDASVTRSTIMKAVVVISRLPFYGIIAAKVESMTRVYFKQQDFADKTCLMELYSNLNYILSQNERESLSPTDSKLLSLSPSKHLLSVFGHRTLVLLKLLLLEKRVLFFLNFSSNPMPSLSNSVVTQYESFSGCGSPDLSPDGSESPTVKTLCLMVLTLASLIPQDFLSHTKDYYLYCDHCQSSSSSPHRAGREETSSDITPSQSSYKMIPAINLFRAGYEVNPYVSLNDIDKLKELPAFVIGATNALFRQKKGDLFDVIVDCETGKMEFADHDLKKQLSLSTEDLRFMEFLCKHSVSSPSNGKEANSFEGGDDWLRLQLYLYQLHLLRTSFLKDDTRDASYFNHHFMRAWKEKTENYKDWKERFLAQVLNPQLGEEDDIDVVIRRSFNNIRSGHPSNHRNSNVMNDMKLRFMTSYGHSLFPVSSRAGSYDLNSKKQAVYDAGKSAISSAKSTFTSWISPQPSEATGSTVPEEDLEGSVESAQDVLESQFNSITYSSLLQSQDEDKEEIVYDRKDFDSL